MSTATVWLLIAAIAAGGFVLRAIFILVPILPREVPPRLSLVLQMVPAAAFAALVAPSLFREDGHLQLISPASLAGVIALLVSFRFKNLALTIVCGLIAYGCLDLLL